MRRLTQTALVALAFLQASSGTALAQSEDTIRQVMEADGEARYAFQQGDYQAALEALVVAQQLVPASPRLYSIAVCYERLGQLDRAIDYYRRFGEAPDAPADRRAMAQERIAELEAELAQPVERRPPPDQTGPEIDWEAFEAERQQRMREAMAEVRRGRQRILRRTFYGMAGLTVVSGAVLAGVATEAFSIDSDFVRWGEEIQGSDDAPGTHALLDASGELAQELADLEDFRQRGLLFTELGYLFTGLTAASALTTSLLAGFAYWPYDDGMGASPAGLFYGVLGATIASAVALIGVGGYTLSRDSEVADKRAFIETNCGPGGLSHDQCLTLRNDFDEYRANTWSYVYAAMGLVGSTAALALTASILAAINWWPDGSSTASIPSLSFAAAPGGGQASLTFRF